jgi:hypothetical protein
VRREEARDDAECLRPDVLRVRRDLERGRTPDDENKPRGKNGKLKGGRYKRDFGIPKETAQENFTDPDSRIMKRAGGGFDAGYNAQTAIDDTAHVIVAAELTNCASDAGELPKMIEAVHTNLKALPRQVLADTGYKAEAVFETLVGCGCDVVVALGREGKAQLAVDPEKMPHTAAMATKLQTDAARHAYARRKWLADPPQRLDQARARVQAVQRAGAAKGPGRVEARVPGAESAQDGDDAGALIGGDCTNCAFRTIMTDRHGIVTGRSATYQTAPHRAVAPGSPIDPNGGVCRPDS